MDIFSTHHLYWKQLSLQGICSRGVPVCLGVVDGVCLYGFLYIMFITGDCSAQLSTEVCGLLGKTCGFPDWFYQLRVYCICRTFNDLDTFQHRQDSILCHSWDVIFISLRMLVCVLMGASHALFPARGDSCSLITEASTGTTALSWTVAGRN